VGGAMLHAGVRVVSGHLRSLLRSTNSGLCLRPFPFGTMPDLTLVETVSLSQPGRCCCSQSQPRLLARLTIHHAAFALNSDGMILMTDSPILRTLFSAAPVKLFHDMAVLFAASAFLNSRTTWK
jgi:hypothetical protein